MPKCSKSIFRITEHLFLLSALVFMALQYVIPTDSHKTLPDTEQELIHNFNTLSVIEGFPTMLGSVKWDEGNI